MTKIQMTKTGLAVALALCAGGAFAAETGSCGTTALPKGDTGDIRVKIAQLKYDLCNTPDYGYKDKLKVSYKAEPYENPEDRKILKTYSGVIRVTRDTGSEGEKKINDKNNFYPLKFTKSDNTVMQFDNTWMCAVTGASHIGAGERFVLVPPSHFIKSTGHRRADTGMAFVSSGVGTEFTLGSPGNFVITKDYWHLYGEKNREWIPEVSWSCFKHEEP